MLFQDMLLKLQQFWADQGCVVLTPYHTEVGAGTSNPATFLRVLGPEPWKTVYIEPSIRPADGRYGENPNRLQHYFQLQVILKPSPENVQDLFLQSLESLGLDLSLHDFRFVEDNWQSPSLGAWGVGWEAWLDGMEVLQFTYFQECGGLKLRPKACELTYGLERIATYLQRKDSVYDLQWSDDVTYGDIFRSSEIECCRYNFREADVSLLFRNFESYEAEASRLLEKGLVIPAYDYCLRLSHTFNLLDARGSFSAAERGRYLLKTRTVAQGCARAYVAKRAGMGNPLLAEKSRESHASSPGGAGVELKREGRRRTFLLEIGVEELPCEHLRSALGQLPGLFEKQLAQNGIEHGEIKVYGSPRRLAVIVNDLADGQNDVRKEVRGPKKTAAFNEKGEWSMAAERFAGAQGAKPGDIVFKKQGKHEYCFVTVEKKGRALGELLSPMVAAVLKGLNFPKTMTWEDNSFSFSRPLRWIVALYGDEVAPVKIQLRKADDEGPARFLIAGRKSRGHRRLRPGAVDIRSAAAYVECMRDNLVMVDREERRRALVKGICDIAGGLGLEFDADAEAELVNEVCDLVEMPHPLVGSIPSDALSLPEEIVTTPMRRHQRYFPLRKADGSLSGRFVCVANGAFSDEAAAIITAGNEKVLNARLRDARFFWDSDRAIPLADHAKQLDKLVFHKKLGTMAAKVARVSRLADYFVEQDLLDIDADKLRLVVSLMKADLTTQMVIEFTSLEGLVASLYAREEGMDDEICAALYEQRLPRRAGDSLPEHALGAVAGILDRLDSLVGYIGIGQKPTGSRDPLGLRRLAAGLLQLLEKYDLDFDIGDWAGKAASAYESDIIGPQEEVARSLVGFLSERQVALSREAGFRHDRVAAVAAAHRGRPRAFRLCLDALSRADEDVLQSLAEHMKRMVKIAKEPAESLEPGLFSDEAEEKLFQLLEKQDPAVSKAVREMDFDVALRAAHEIVPAVVGFFDTVLINAEDDKLRRNRHRLVADTASFLAKIADFTMIEKKG